MKAMKGAFVFLMCLLANRMQAQTLEDIAVLKKQEQTCLDKGLAMMACSEQFCGQMDSLLNLAYNNLRKLLDEKGKAALKADERSWLKKRDQRHNAMMKEAKKELDIKPGEQVGEDYYMVLYNKDADFIKERVITLIKRRNK